MASEFKLDDLDDMAGELDSAIAQVSQRTNKVEEVEVAAPLVPAPAAEPVPRAHAMVHDSAFDWSALSGELDSAIAEVSQRTTKPKETERVAYPVPAPEALANSSAPPAEKAFDWTALESDGSSAASSTPGTSSVLPPAAASPAPTTASSPAAKATPGLEINTASPPATEKSFDWSSLESGSSANQKPPASPASPVARVSVVSSVVASSASTHSTEGSDGEHSSVRSISPAKAVRPVSTGVTIGRTHDGRTHDPTHEKPHDKASPDQPKPLSEKEKQQKIEEAMQRLQQANMRRMTVQIFLNDREHAKTVEISSLERSEKNVLDVVERAQVEMNPTWTVFEVYGKYDIERPVRPIERLIDITWIWDRDASNNCFVLRLYDNKPQLEFTGRPVDPPSLSGSLHFEVKRGKWQKKHCEITLHGIQSGKELLCSWSDVDVYMLTAERKKAPTRFTFALKVQSKIPPHEPDDEFEYVKYVAAETMQEMEQWITAIRNARLNRLRSINPDYIPDMTYKDAIARANSSPATSPTNVEADRSISEPGSPSKTELEAKAAPEPKAEPEPTPAPEPKDEPRAELATDPAPSVATAALQAAESSLSPQAGVARSASTASSKDASLPSPSTPALPESILPAVKIPSVVILPPLPKPRLPPLPTAENKGTLGKSAKALQDGAARATAAP